MTTSEEIIKKITAERDSYKDLVERAAIAMSIIQWGNQLAVGKQVSIGEYTYTIGWNTDGDEHTATLVVKDAY